MSWSEWMSESGLYVNVCVYFSTYVFYKRMIWMYLCAFFSVFMPFSIKYYYYTNRLNAINSTKITHEQYCSNEVLFAWNWVEKQWNNHTWHILSAMSSYGYKFSNCSCKIFEWEYYVLYFSSIELTMWGTIPISWEYIPVLNSSTWLTPKLRNNYEIKRILLSWM